MREKIKLLIAKFTNWFPLLQAEVQAQAADVEAKINQKKENLSPLPIHERKKLKKKIKSLPTPSVYQQALRSQLEEAVDKWQKSEDAPNTLVILNNPIEPLTKLIDESLAQWQQKHLWQIKSLSWSTRPPNYFTIKPQLFKEMELSEDENDEKESTEGKPLRHKILMVIPDLSLCFLRCFDGLEAINYLQDLVLKDSSIFWLIGCNEWAWEYFSIVCKLDAYFEQTFSVPRLKDIEIKEWLTPVSDKIEFDFDKTDLGSDNDNSEKENDRESDWTCELEKEYYGHLAKVSLGLSSVASNLWLRSLNIKKTKSESDDQNAFKLENNYDKKVILKRATIPELPNLSQDDLYILFSLYLHGSMNLKELALSLGEHKNIIQSQIQVLCRLGFIYRHKDQLSVNPINYLRLRRDFVNNQFLVSGEN